MKIFDSIKVSAPKRNKFDLSHERKFSMEMGPLTCILNQEILPGDKFRVNTELLIRFAPMLAPIMHRVNAHVHYFFVPNRLLWSEWEDFITGGRNGDLAPVPPYIKFPFQETITNYTGVGSLADYLGLPPAANPSSVPNHQQNVSALPFRAYQLVWNEYFRDQNLIADLELLLTGGEVLGAERDKLMMTRIRAWERDYFTSALPWAQRGQAVGIPIDGDIGVNYSVGSLIKQGDGTLQTGDSLIGTNVAGSPGSMFVGKTGVNTGGLPGRIENIDSLDLQNASVAVNDLRVSVRLQEWLEKNARAGARYIEQILAHFGVKSSDSRLQRPEFLGGSRQPVVVSEVLSNFQFSGDPDGLPQGNMAGHGISVGGRNGFSRSFEEHGYVIGVLSLLPKTAYQQGLPKSFQRFSKFDYFWPEFANIGEQEILQKEIWFDSTEVAPTPDATFGYQSRYAEYKYTPSTVHGDFRTSLDHWHMGRIFTAPPVLNQQFVEADPTTRIFAVTDPVNHLWVQVFHKVDALRPLPYFGTPRL